jgi:hypothetical protein
LNGVHDGCLLAQAREAGLKLENAAGVAGGDNVSAKIGD